MKKEAAVEYWVVTLNSKIIHMHGYGYEYGSEYGFQSQFRYGDGLAVFDNESMAIDYCKFARGKLDLQYKVVKVNIIEKKKGRKSSELNL